MQKLILSYPNKAEVSYKQGCKAMFYCFHCYRVYTHKNMSEHNKYIVKKCYNVNILKILLHFL